MLAEKRLPPAPTVAQPERLVATLPLLRGGSPLKDPCETADPAVPNRSAAIGSRTIAIVSCMPGPASSGSIMMSGADWLGPICMLAVVALPSNSPPPPPPARKLARDWLATAAALPRPPPPPPSGFRSSM
eukprot:SAG22_NODE_1050_length_5831_cov_4.044138_2_plen_130_part_00